MKGLIIKTPWISHILDGKKTWEIRGSQTHIRGRIALIQSGTGTVLGEVDLVHSIPLSLEEFRSSTKRHLIQEALDLPYKKTHAWVLENPFRYPEPLPYVHPQGAVIWVNI